LFRRAGLPFSPIPTASSLPAGAGAPFAPFAPFPRLAASREFHYTHTKFQRS
jgi:hypothetical protein